MGETLNFIIKNAGHVALKIVLKSKTSETNRCLDLRRIAAVI